MITAHAMNVGDGYQYLTNHVARGDVDRPQQPGPTPSLTDYYARSGYPAGRWMGSGLAGLDGTLNRGDRVEEEALAALFARCEDPTSGAQLGRPPQKYPDAETRAATKIAALPEDLSDDEKDAAVASIQATEAKRGTPQPVAGFDLTATVPKSVSALWAVADPSTQQAILDAHHATLSDIVDYLEREVIFTRTGHAGAAQVDTRGIIAAGFDHWDTRATDPNLHTHLIVSNRVQSRDGDWLTIDSRTLFRAAVAFSELYDAMLADRLTAELGVGWEARERRTRRTVAHEVSTIPEALILEFSQRSEGIERRTEELIDQFGHNQGRLPTVAETIVLRKQATVETRAAKRHPEPFDSLSAGWRDRAERVTGLTPDELTASTLNTARGKPMRSEDFNDKEIDTLGVLAVAAAQERKSTWNHWNLTTEATRLTHGIRLASPGDREQLNKRIVAAAISHSLTVDTAFHAAPGVEGLQRADGESVFTTHGGARFTSHAILGAEAYLTDRGTRTGGPATHVQPSEERGLSDDQRIAVERIGSSGRHLEVLIGPAGTGKTTTLAALRDTWMAAHGPGSVLGLAPSAAAADVLSESLEVDCENTAKWLHETVGGGAQRRAEAHHRLTKSAKRARTPSAKRNINGRLVDIETTSAKWQMRPNQLVIVDEASLAGTLALAALAHQAEAVGAKLLLVGDHGQLSAVDAGGALRMLARDPNTVTLNTVWRFSNEWERDASLNLRRGRTDTLDTYTEHGRTHEGTHADMLDDAYQAWLADTSAGHTSLLIAADNATVNTLNHRARQDLIATGQVEPDGVPLRGDTLAGVGDRIVTRENNRRLSDGNEWVHNGDIFTVIARHHDGSLTVQRDANPDGHAGVVTLPGDYVTAHVNLAYATTAYRAQGSTVDTAHTLATTGLSRETLYVAMTRGRHANHVYAATDRPGDDPEDTRHHIQPTTGHEVLDAILRRSDADQSATESIIAAQQAAQSMATLVPIYEHIAHQHSTIRWQPILRANVQDETTVEAIRGSDAWPKITGLLRSLNLTAIDAEGAFADAITKGFDIDSDADPGAVIAGRLARTLNDQSQTPQPVRYIAGMIVPAEPADDPAIQAAIDSAAGAIQARAGALVHEALATNAPWIRQLGDPPNGPSGNPTWWSAAHATATYRDRWGVISDTPLGATSKLDRDQRRDRQRAQRAIDTLNVQPTRSPQPAPDEEPVPTASLTR